ncbi:MAG: methylated-DNA--[protein]-cysteine S-methyltransferase [Rhodocyclaceae bacterium]|nr:methylated-DNA--[protein]-cysteine S-methyltransferase [Rhodocyclaceae bacterium]
MSAFAAIFSLPAFAIGVRVTAAEDALEEIVFLEAGISLAPRAPLAREAIRQLAAYFQDPRFAFSLPLSPAGTAFQQRVWQAIAAIPVGETLSYGALAQRLGTSARAVGQACGANPYPLVIPCHRVVGARGALGGFARMRNGFFPATKQWLLAHERR